MKDPPFAASEVGSEVSIVEGSGDRTVYTRATCSERSFTTCLAPKCRTATVPPA
jgi:hypothetical protein